MAGTRDHLRRDKYPIPCTGLPVADVVQHPSTTRPADTQIDHGTSAFFTVRYGELEDVEVILASGVDANHQDAHGNTALHQSCANGHADVIRALIKAGARHLPNAAGNR